MCHGNVDLTRCRPPGAVGELFRGNAPGRHLDQGWIAVSCPPALPRVYASPKGTSMYARSSAARTDRSDHKPLRGRARGGHGATRRAAGAAVVAAVLAAVPARGATT